MKNKKAIILVFFLFVIFVYVTNIDKIPSKIILLNGEKLKVNTLFGIELKETKEKTVETWKSGQVKSKSYSVMLLGNIPVKTVNVVDLPEVKVVPLGNLIGLKLYTNGVLVVGMSEIESSNNEKCKPYEGSNIKEGDTIIEMNSTEIDSVNTLKKVVNSSNGKDITVKYVRDGTVLTSSIQPVKTANDEYKIGLWVRDSATGVGTISFYEPTSGKFAALGHGIYDIDTEELLDIGSGELVTSKLINIVKGEVGKPGEIRGSIANGLEIGNVNENTIFGIYGKITNLTSLGVDVSKAIDVGLRDEIKTGEATILCDIDSNGIKEYKVEIEKIDVNNNQDNKSMQIKVTDEELINKTGGIVCGMSGSPVIQNGKIVGVITNVLVSNPRIGYAVFADLMIKEMMY